MAGNRLLTRSRKYSTMSSPRDAPLVSPPPANLGPTCPSSIAVHHGDASGHCLQPILRRILKVKYLLSKSYSLFSHRTASDINLLDINPAGVLIG
jgi:hypothetical protein